MKIGTLESCIPDGRYIMKRLRIGIVFYTHTSDPVLSTTVNLRKDI